GLSKAAQSGPSNALSLRRERRRLLGGGRLLLTRRLSRVKVPCASSARGGSEGGANVPGVAALVGGHQAEVVLGRAVFARAQMAEPVERGVVEPVEQREHLAVCRLELGSQLLGRRVRPPSHLAGVPAVGVEVSRRSTLAGGH